MLGGAFVGGHVWRHAGDGSWRDRRYGDGSMARGMWSTLGHIV